jgi:hypothetical protein
MLCAFWLAAFNVALSVVRSSTRNASSALAFFSAGRYVELEASSRIVLIQTDCTLSLSLLRPSTRAGKATLTTVSAVVPCGVIGQQDSTKQNHADLDTN